jgi:hypothetical protein
VSTYRVYVNVGLLRPLISADFFALLFVKCFSTYGYVSEDGSPISKTTDRARIQRFAENVVDSAEDSLVLPREITLKTGMEEGGRTDHSSWLSYVRLSLQEKRKIRIVREFIFKSLPHANNTKEVKKLDDHDLPSPLLTSSGSTDDSSNAVHW